jgi:hypothetical protein
MAMSTQDKASKIFEFFEDATYRVGERVWLITKDNEILKADFYKFMQNLDKIENKLPGTDMPPMGAEPDPYYHPSDWYKDD